MVAYVSSSKVLAEVLKRMYLTHEKMREDPVEELDKFEAQEQSKPESAKDNLRARKESQTSQKKESRGSQRKNSISSQKKESRSSQRSKGKYEVKAWYTIDENINNFKVLL